MIYWAVVFIVLALIAALLGFTGIAEVAVYLAVVLFVIGLVLAVIFMIGGRGGRAVG